MRLSALAKWQCLSYLSPFPRSSIGQRTRFESLTGEHEDNDDPDENVQSNSDLSRQRVRVRNPAAPILDDMIDVDRVSLPVSSSDKSRHYHRSVRSRLEILKFNVFTITPYRLNLEQSNFWRAFDEWKMSLILRFKPTGGISPFLYLLKLGELINATSDTRRSTADVRQSNFGENIDDLDRHF